MAGVDLSRPRASARIADAHEWRKPKGDKASQMDLHNNAYGRHFWLDHRQRTMRGWWTTRMLKKAGESGDLVAIRKGF